MNNNKLPPNKGFILIGALLMLSLGLSALCLLLAAQNHHHIWRQRMHRLSESRTQRNRIIRISHRMMDCLMCDALPEKETILNPEYWLHMLERCTDGDEGFNTIKCKNQILSEDPFEPDCVDLELTLTSRDKQPGMAHQGIFQGRYFSGCFPLGSVPMLLNDPNSASVPYDSLFSRISLPRNSFSSRSASPFEPESWLDPLPLLTSPLGLENRVPDWRVLGRIVGLDLNTAPGEGVYTVLDQGTLKALLVYGNLDKLILSQKNERQCVEFFGSGFRSHFSYSISPTFCSLSQSNLPTDTQFSQNIVIIGNINSLEQSGEFGLTSFCNLYIYVDGAICINGSIRSQPPTSEKAKQGSLILISAGIVKEAVSLPPGISWGPGRGLHLDGHLITTGTIQCSGEELTLTGSLSATEIKGQQPRIQHTKPRRTLPLGPEIRFFKNLLFMGIEEVFDDN